MGRTTWRMSDTVCCDAPCSPSQPSNFFQTLIVITPYFAQKNSRKVWCSFAHQKPPFYPITFLQIWSHVHTEFFKLSSLLPLTWNLISQILHKNCQFCTNFLKFCTKLSNFAQKIHKKFIKIWQILQKFSKLSKIFEKLTQKNCKLTQKIAN